MSAVYNALSPVVQAGFDASSAHTQAKYAQSNLKIDAVKQRIAILNAAGATLPQVSSGPSVLAYVALGITLLVVIIVGLVFLVNRTI